MSYPVNIHSGAHAEAEQRVFEQKVQELQDGALQSADRLRRVKQMPRCFHGQYYTACPPQIFKVSLAGFGDCGQRSLFNETPR